MTRFTAPAATLALLAALAVPATAQAPAQVASPASVSVPTRAVTGFETFVPRPTRQSRFDYSVWDEALDDMVLDLGPSLRQRARTVQRTAGSNLVRGHRSAYRLEGSRFTFAYVDDSFEQGLSDYRADLEELGTRYDIASLPRTEQLAYWLNLHNVALIEMISRNYPVVTPSRMKVRVDGRKQPLDTAKFITVKGVPLSLNDIRTKIVFPNFPDYPNAMYGFFRGDIGSPSLPDQAYSGDRLGYLLSSNAEEFVNSLRGFNLGSKSRNVSQIYQEAAPFFFPELGDDLIDHMARLARPEVEEQMRTPRPIRFDNYDSVIADLSAGGGRGTSGSSNARASISPEALRLIRETGDKYRQLSRDGLIGQGRGVVIIEDIATEDLTPDPQFSPYANGVPVVD